MMRTASGLLALLLLAGTARAEKPVEDLVRELGVPATRGAALVALRARLDPAAIPLLAEKLPGYDWAAQLYGASILYLYRNDRGDAALRELTRSPPPFLRLVAGYYLYLRGEKSAALAVADALSEDGVAPGIRVQMVARAMGVREPPVYAAIAGLFRPGEAPAVLSYALYAVGIYGTDSEARAAENLLREEDAGIRAFAAAVLFRFGYEEHADVLADAIRTGEIAPVEWARMTVVLARCSRSALAVREALAERLGKENDPKTLQMILTLLKAFPHPPALDAIRARVTDADDEVAAAAFDALLAIPGAATPERLLPLLAAERDAVKLRVADALRRMDDGSGLTVAVAVLAKGGREDRAEAARILGAFATGAVVDPLVTALLDGEEQVRTAAHDALVEVLGKILPYRTVNFERAGYNPRMKPVQLGPAVARIREWWAEARGRDW